MIGYEPLIAWSPDGKTLVPNLAEHVEVSPDSRVFAFRLRPGVKWSDGQPLTSDDFVFWYNDVALNKALSPHGPPRLFITEGSPARIEKISDLEFRYIFKSPAGLFRTQLASGMAPALVQPKHYAVQFHERYNKKDLTERMRSAGVSAWARLYGRMVGAQGSDAGLWTNPDLPTLNAWKIKTPYDGSATEVLAIRNPFYWKVDKAGNQLPYIDRMAFTIIGDPEVLKLMTMNGQMDFVYQPQNFGISDKPFFFDRRKFGNYHFIPLNADVSAAMVISINLLNADLVKRGVLGQKAVRIALSLAINRPRIIDIIYTGQGIPYQMAPRPESPFYNARMATQFTQYDPATANAILDKLGYRKRDADGFRLLPDGRQMRIVVDVRTDTKQQIDVLELIKRDWAEIGVNLYVNAMDSGLYLQRQRSNNYDAVSNVGAGGLYEMLNPRQYVPISDAALYGIGWSRWYAGDPRGDRPPLPTRLQFALYDQITNTPDPAIQTELFRRILTISADEFRLIGISLQSGGYAIASNRIANLPDTMIDSIIYPTPGPSNLSAWFIRSKSR